MKKIALTLILMACIHLGYAQNSLVKQWDYRFGGLGDEFISVIQQTTDGGYIMGGVSTSDSSGNKKQHSRGSYDCWIVKIDSLGHYQWDKDFGGSGGEILSSLQQTKDGGYILGGASSSSNGDKTDRNWDTLYFSYDFWVIKIDSMGIKKWDKGFGGTSNDFISSVQQTADNGYILGGYSYSDSSGNKPRHSYGSYDYWVVKIDAHGNYQWDNAFGGSGEDELTAICQTTDGGYIMAGPSNSGLEGNKTAPSFGNYDYWVIKIDSAGTKQWENTFGGTGDDIPYSLLQTTDGGYIVGGVSGSGITGNKTEPNRDTTDRTSDYWIVKIDASGNMQWDKSYGGTFIEEQFGSITQTTNGGFLMAGTSYSPASGEKTEDNLAIEETWVVKTDSAGIQQWDKTILTLGESEAGLALQCKDGSYIIANHNSSVPGGDVTQPCFGFNDFWLAKFRDTAITTGIHLTMPFKNELSVYPNPCTDEITITFQKQNAATASFAIYDVMGRQVFTSNENKLSGVYSKKIDIYNLQNGIYFLNVTANGTPTMVKIVKQ